MATRPEPSGPICAFGSRLAYTYFPSPAPLADDLNSHSPTTATVTATATATATPTSSPSQPTTLTGDYWFTIDDQLVYLSFFQDYGPLNIGCLYRFCLHLHNLLEDPAHRHQRIFLYSSDEPDKKVNAALLMSLYAMVVMRWSVADVLHPISCLELQPYRDAGYSRSDYHLHCQAILYGLSRALAHQLLDLSTFDLAAYERAEKVEEGDWNWITPGFLAFASPVEAGWNTTSKTAATTTTTTGHGGGGGRLTRSFRNVLEEFENKNVRVVVRLNKKLYDRQHFLERGIDHVEMYFDDGTNPTMEMCREFIDLSDRVISAGGAVAVHCKAGLGRTGTLIGAYLIYKHGFTADEAIGFMRLMRPGSCVGPQQHFLYENQLEWVKWSAQDELRAELAASAASSSQPRLHESLPGDRTGRGAAACSVETGEGGGEGGAGPRRPITPPNESELELRARNRSTTPHHPPPPPAALTTTTAVVGLQNPPVTPRRQTTNVPGQPRKTPGRSRHGVAAPEEKDKDSPAGIVAVAVDDDDGDAEMEAAVRDEEEMEGVVLTSSSPNKKLRDSLGGGGARSTRRTSARKSLQLVQDDNDQDEDDKVEDAVTAEEEDEVDSLNLLPNSTTTTTTGVAPPKSPKKLVPLRDLQPSSSKPSAPPPPPPAASTSTRPKTPSSAASTTTTTTTTRPTRIARSANAAAPSAPSDDSTTIARSKGAKNLNTVFEAVEGGGSGAQGGGPLAATTTTTRSRYPLRNASGRTTPTTAMAASSTLTTAAASALGGGGVMPPNSPSKLPTRIPAKRGAAAAAQQPGSPGTGSHHHHHAANAAAGFSGKDSSTTGSTSSTTTTTRSGGGDGGGFQTSLKNGLAKLAGNNGGTTRGRNVRRRRSSMGSQDFVQAG